MNEAIVKIINEWDPIDLFPFAPKDEYYGEIAKIEKYLMTNRTTDVTLLATKIDEIFVDAFGKNIYTKTIDDSIKVANEIICCLSM